MIETALDILSWIALVSGAAFYLIGAVGLIRMPDVFTRMHAVSVSDTLGAGLLFLGMSLQSGATLVTVKLAFIILIVWATGAVATHALARAALHDGEKPLLTAPNGQLRPTDVVTLFPELGVRLAAPLSSETVEEIVESAHPHHEDRLRSAVGLIAASDGSEDAGYGEGAGRLEARRGETDGGPSSKS